MLLTLKQGGGKLGTAVLRDVTPWMASGEPLHAGFRELSCRSFDPASSQRLRKRCLPFALLPPSTRLSASVLRLFMIIQFCTIEGATSQNF